MEGFVPARPPALAAAIGPLTTAGLVEARVVRDMDGGESWTYALHPGVAEAGRAEAGEPFQTTVDAVLAEFWIGAYQHGRETNRAAAAR